MVPLNERNRTNGASPELDLDPRVLDQLGWTRFWDKLQRRLEQELEQTRKVRPLLQLFENVNLDPDALLDFRQPSSKGKNAVIKPDDDISLSEGRGPQILHAPPRPTVAAAEIRQDFQLTPDQYGNPSVALHLISKAAHKIGLAEDALLLYGPDVDEIQHPSKKHSGETYRDEFRYLRSVTYLHAKEQDRGLFQSPTESGKSQGPAEPPKPKAPISITSRDLHPVIHEITQGIANLCFNDHFGPYCLLVTRLLYTQMHRIELGTVPIAEFMPLLRNDGVGCIARLHNLRDVSPAGMEQGKWEFAILWSNGGSAVGLAVPSEAHLELVRMDRGAILSVRERARLIINDESAVITLGPWDISALVENCNTIHGP